MKRLETSTGKGKTKRVATGKERSKAGTSPARIHAPVSSPKWLQQIFDTAPVSIWVEDFSKVKKKLDALRKNGVTDFKQYFTAHPEFVQKAASLVKVLDVNQTSLDLYEAQNKTELLGSLEKNLVPEALKTFEDELVAVAEGKRFFTGEIPDRTLRGKPLTLLRSIVFPEKLDRVLVSFADITERKQAEDALRHSHSLLDATLESTTDGILVVASDGRVSSYNHKFVELWRIPDEIAAQKDDRLLIEFVLSQLKNPAAFVAKVEALYQSPEMTSFDELEFLDGRVFERYSQPQRLGEQVIGRVWSFRDVTERRQAERALHESNTRFSQIADNIHEVFWMFDNVQNRVVYVSPGYEKIWGCRPEELYANPSIYIDSIHPEDRVVMFDALERQARGQETLMEYRVVHPNGEVRWVIDRSFPIFDGNGKLIRTTGFAEDVTEKKQAELLQAATFQIGEAANKSSNLDDLFERVHHIIGQVMPAQNFYISLYDEQDDLISFPYYVDEVDGVALEPATKPGRGMTEYVIRTGRSLLSDASNFEELVRMGEVELVGMPSPIWVGVPLKLDGHTIGVIALQSYDNPQAYTERELRILEFVSDQVARAIERTRLYDELQHRNHILSALQTATLPLIKQTELSEVLQEILAQVARLFNDANGFIFLVKPDESEMVISMEIGQARRPGLRVKKGQGLAGKVWETGKPMRVDNYSQWEDRLGILDGDDDFRTVVGVPFFANGRVSGVLGLSHLKPSQLTDADMEFLNRFAELASIAIENARLHTMSQQELMERKIAQAALYESNQRLSLHLQQTLLGVIELDVDFRVVQWNPGAERIFGFTATEALGKRPEEFMLPDHVKQHVDDIWLALLKRNGGERSTNENLTKDGKTIICEWYNTPLIDSRGIVFGVISLVQDVTERKQAEEALQASESKYRLAARATNDVIWEWDIVNDQESWSENIHTLFGYSLGDIATASAWWEDHIHRKDCQRVLSRLKEILENHENLWEEEYRFIRSDGSVAYVIDRGYVERDGYGKPIRMIGAMSDLTERKHREDELEALAVVSAALRVAGSRAEMLPIILDQVLGLLDAFGAVLVLRQSSGEILKTEAARGAWVGSEGLLIPRGVSASWHVLETGEPYFVSDVENDPHLYRKDLLKGVRNFISLPLSTPNGRIGTLNVGRDLPFKTEEVRLLMNIADVAANAIQRVSAYDQIKRQIERLNALRTIDMFIASGTDLRLTLQTLLAQAVAQLNADAVDVLLLSEPLKLLEFAEGSGFRTNSIEKTSLRIGEGFAGQAALQRKPVLADGVSTTLHGFVRKDLIAQEGFVAYCGIPLIAKGDVMGVLEVFLRSPLSADAEWMDFLESLAGQAALAIDNASLFQNLQRSNLELGLAYETTLEGWSAALDLRDKETEGHTRRVTELTMKLAQAMNLTEAEQIHIRRGALLHDIGKMGIPDRILLKPDSLTAEEWEIMRQHPIYAFNLLSPIAHLQPALDIPYCHHEKWDGTGYPRKLKGEAIPLAARIFAIADVWDALRSDRPYRPAWTKERALEHITSLAGTHFDPKVVEAFLKVIWKEDS